MLAASQIDLSAQKKKDKDNTSTDEKKEEKSILEKTSFSGLKFRNIGPAITSGRISDFAMHPDNPKIYYVATAAGGVWKTNNAGTMNPSIRLQNQPKPIKIYTSGQKRISHWSWSN